jgi:hypothetical protein
MVGIACTSSRKVGRRGEDLLARERPASLRFLGLELHVRSVGSSLRLAVAHRELDLRTEDPGEELLLELVAAVTDQRLADDPDALADLRRSPPRKRFVEQVLVDALPGSTPILFRPGHAEPALLRELAHEGAAGRCVDDLRHVLPGHVHDLGSLFSVEEALDLFRERPLGFRELEIHAPPPVLSGLAARGPNRSRDSIRDVAYSKSVPWGIFRRMPSVRSDSQPPGHADRTRLP